MLIEDIFKSADKKEVKKRSKEWEKLSGRKKTTFHYDFFKYVDDGIWELLNDLVDETIPSGVIATDINYSFKKVTSGGVITIEAEYTPETYE